MITATPSIFDFTSSREIDAYILDVRFPQHERFKQSDHYSDEF
jgi:hypothetical protein